MNNIIEIKKAYQNEQNLCILVKLSRRQFIYAVIKKLDQILISFSNKNNKQKVFSMYDNIKKARRDPIIKNIKNLQETLLKAQVKNNAKYNEIIKLNPNFHYKLHRPIIPSYETRQQLSLAQNILMNQIDKCMEDEQKLNMELDKLQIKVKEQEIKIEKQLQLNMDHFTFLRKIWKKDQQASSSENKADQLIHNVGSIKGHILHVIKKQTNLCLLAPQINELVISSPQYCELLKKYEDLKAEMQKINQQKQQITNYSSEGSIQNEDYKKQMQILQSEVCKLKKDIQTKNHQIKRLKTQMKFSEQDQINRICKTSQNGKHQHDFTNNTLSYNFIAADASFKINIKQIRKIINQNQQINKQIFVQSDDQIYMKTTQTLEGIVKYLEGNDCRKIGRTNLELEMARESKTKKYTVQQIARPKFISNKQILANKNTQSTQV